MLRSQTAWIGILAVGLAILWGLDACNGRRLVEQRLRDSTLAPLGAGIPITVEEVERIELVIPGSDVAWSYRRDAIGWRLPGYRAAFALAPRVDGILDAVVSGRGTVVGTHPAQAQHFGVTPEAAMQVALFDRGDELLARVLAGAAVAGAKAGESYMLVEGRTEILHMDTNARTALDGAPVGRYPPLLDRRVIPEAFGRRGVVTISFTGPRATGLRSILREELPADPASFRGPDSGPRYEWYGTLGAGARKRLDDRATRAWVNRIVGLTFDEILGNRAALPDPSPAPLLVATLAYEQDAQDVLELYPAGTGDDLAIYNATTDQLYLIGADAASALAPDPQALAPVDPAPPNGG